MTTRQHRPSKLRRFILPVVTIAFLGYFAYHSVHGEYGMVGRTRMETKTAQLKAELERLREQKAELLGRVALMRPSSLDQDMVDERARLSLSMVHPNEVVIMLDHQVALQNN
jgi:cell division protein FtsB